MARLPPPKAPPPAPAPPLGNLLGPSPVQAITQTKKPRAGGATSPTPPPLPLAPKTPKEPAAPPDLAAPTPPPVLSGPPVAALAQYGVAASMPQVNQTVGNIAQAHVTKFGHNPSPGLVFDLLRASSTLGSNYDFNQLFSVGTQRDAQMQALRSATTPQGTSTETSVRPDGLVVHPLPPQFGKPETLDQLHKQYPTVPMGMVPLPNAEDVYSAVSQMMNTPGTLKVSDQGQTFDQAAKIAEYASGSVEQGYAAAYHARRLVKTVQDAQTSMNAMMGTHLPVTGVFNQDWQKAWADYTKTKAYFQRAFEFQAKQAGVTPAAYLKAFKAKSEAVKKHGAWQFFFNALPIQAWTHGSSPWSVLEGVVSSPFSNPSFSLDYPLHVLSRSAGMALHVTGGTIEQAKADAAAGSAFFSAVEPKWMSFGGIQGKGESFDQGIAKAKKALVANPSWLRVFYPDLPEHETGALKAIDQISNFAGDIILLRKATWTGETVRAGDVLAASRSTYLHRAARYAHDYAGSGKLGRAASMLEGGAGAERLVAAAAKAIKTGRMSFEQFKQHVAELYANGETTIETLPKDNPNLVNVYHGTTRAFDELKPQMGENSGASLTGTKGVYLTEDPKVANTYTDFSARGGTGEAPNVRLHRVDQRNLFDRSFESDRAATPAKVAKLKTRIEKVLTPEELNAVQTTEHGGIHTWSSTSNPQEVYRQLVESFKGGDTSFKVEQKAVDQAADVLERAGFKGIIEGDAGKRSFYMFNTKDVLPRFEKPVSVTIEGPVLSTLRGKGIPTPSATSMIAHKVVRDWIDEFHPLGGGTLGNYATDFTSWLRSKAAHAAPRSPRAYFDPKLPERLHDFALLHFKDPQFANDVESALIRARATQNVAKIQKIERQIQRMYFKKYSVGDKQPIEDDPFSPLLSTEAGSRFHFPSGNSQPITNPFNAISVTANKINKLFNKATAMHRRLLIISPSLFYKHAVGDTLRRIVGGDDIFFGGLKEEKAAIKAITANSNVMARRYGSFLDRTTNGEAYYMAAPGERSVTFETGDFFKSHSYMKAAGADLRRLLEDDAFAAYSHSTADDLAPLIELIETNPVYRRLWASSQKQAAVKMFGSDTIKMIGESGLSPKDVMEAAMPVENYAQLLFNRYGKVAEAARAQGQTLDDAKSVLRENQGAGADEALGKWISENRVDYKIKNALVSNNYSFDNLTSKIVGKIMYANKRNRQGFAENIAASNFKALKAAGWDDENALHTAMDVAEKQVIYHMLDFSNMLQVEQDLRWLSYFATKYRLYWKWVGQTMVRQPGLPALITDAKQHLDHKGNFNFTIFGHHLAVPAARLVWVQSKEYPETSPFYSGLKSFLANGFNISDGLNAAAGPQGTGINRDAGSFLMVAKIARMEMGDLPASYTAASSGLTATQQVYLNREMNHLNADYFNKHGHYAKQSEIVKQALVRLAAGTFWNSNLPFPVIPVSAPNDTQKLLDQAMQIPDPVMRSKFFDDHPEVTASFGVSKNPADYQHSRRFFGLYAQARAQYLQAREEIYQNARKEGHMTIQMEEQRQKIGNDFSKVFDHIKALDLQNTPPGKRKEINGELLGSWGQQISADTLINPLSIFHNLFPNLPVPKLKAALPGSIVKVAERELQLLKDPAFIATFQDPSEVKTRQRELLQVIQDFRAYPHDALGKIQDTYQTKYVNAYWAHVEAANKQIATLGRGSKDLAYANLRQWKDEQDHPVKINGVTFPSPIKLAWADMPPDVRRDRIAALATGSWDHLADYEKTLLGLKPGAGVSEGWDALLAAKKNYAHEQHLKGLSPTLQANQIIAIVQQIDKQRPGFAADWRFAHQPSIYRFQKTVVYADMPKAVKAFWDSSIAPNAEAFAKAIKDHTTRSSADRAKLATVWEDAVQKQFMPAINSDPVLKRWFDPLLVASKGDFLNSLVK